MPETVANNEFLTKILERFDQLDEKFMGEIRQLDQKLTSEIQAARKESREFHDASKETWKHLERVLANAAQKAAAYEEKRDRQWQEHQRMALEIWDGIRRTIEKSDQRTLNYETALARLEKEIEDLKKDKSAKDMIIEEFTKDRLAKDATIKDLQQRIGRLEMSQNFAN